MRRRTLVGAGILCVTGTACNAVFGLEDLHMRERDDASSDASVDGDADSSKDVSTGGEGLDGDGSRDALAESSADGNGQGTDVSAEAGDSAGDSRVVGVDGADAIDDSADAGVDGNAWDAREDSDGPATCTRNEDCDDRNPCNGLERCQESVCMVGSDPCPNPDIVRCERSCTPVGGAAQCGAIRAADNDGDGHRAKSCTADPTGDDCDDAQVSVHPGAPEICDGLDNDCNGKIDIADGKLPLGHHVTFASGYRPDVSWSPEKKHYGVTWHDNTGATILFNAVEKTAVRVYQDKPLVSVDGGLLFDNKIAWGSDSFGVVWDGVNFQRFDSAGIALTSPLFVPGGAPSSLVQLQQGSWLVLWSSGTARSQSTYGRTISADGKLGDSTLTFGLSQGGANIALSGDNAGIIRSSASAISADDYTWNLQWTRHGPTMQLLGTEDLATVTSANGIGHAGSPVIAATSSTYALAWRNQSAMGALSVPFVEYRRDGTRLCALENLRDFLDPNGPDFRPTQMVASTLGYVMLLLGSGPASSTFVRAMVVRHGCEFVETFIVDQVQGSASAAKIAPGNGTGFTIVFSAGESLATSSIYLSAFGPHFCD